MDPDTFIKQEEVVALSNALEKFALYYPVANERRDILVSAGVSDTFFPNLNLPAMANAFSTSLLAKFIKFRVSERQPDYHPLLAFLGYLVDSGLEKYGLDDGRDRDICLRLLERGRENLQALRCRSAVGRIESPPEVGLGTGVYVGHNLLLTCRHVFNDLTGTQAWVRFAYRPGSLGLEPVFELDLQFVSSDRQPDFALLSIKGNPQQNAVSPIVKQLSSGPETRVRLIHHPKGQPVVVSEVGQILQVGDDYLDHNIKTDDGSSGAPLFDHRWDFIAIHRGHPSGGRTVSPHGSEAVPLSAIWSHLAAFLS